MFFENISENYPKTYIWEIYLGDQTREMGGYSIPGNSKQFQSWNLKGRGARAHSEIIKMHLWQTGVSARVRIHTKETAMPAQCTIGGEADNESIVCVLPRKHNSVPSMKWYKRRIDYERFPQNWDQEWQQGRMRFLLLNDQMSFTQDEEARAEDEKVGRLEPMLSRPQRYEQHPRGGHAQARVQDYIGRPAQKTVSFGPSVVIIWRSQCTIYSWILMLLYDVPPDRTWCFQDPIFSWSWPQPSLTPPSSTLSDPPQARIPADCILLKIKALILDFLWKSSIIGNHSS